jgi:hypothetical protein
MHTYLRQFIFYTLVTVFLVVGAYLVTLTGGWVPDFKRLRIVETGAIFLKFEPTDALITLDGAPVERNDSILTSGTLIPKLAPGSYSVAITKPGFSTWEKRLTVQSGEVAAASHVTLWPLAPQMTTLLSGNKAFWFTSVGLVVQTERDTLRMGDTLIKGTTVVLSDPNSTAVVTEDGGSYFYTDLESPEGSLNLSALLSSLTARTGKRLAAESIQQAFWHPFTRGKVILRTKTSLYALDTRKVELETLASTTAPYMTATLVGNTLLALDASSTLTTMNLFVRTTATTTLDIPGVVREIGTTADNETIFARTDDGTLYQYDRPEAKTQLLARDVIRFAISPEEKRLALASRDGSLELVFLDAYMSDTRERAGSRVPLGKAPGIDVIESLDWMRGFSTYLLIFGNGRLATLEADTRPPQQATLLMDGLSSAVYESQVFGLRTDGDIVSFEVAE